MSFDFDRMIGRFVVDIDGCLRSTNAQRINAEAIIALHGGLDAATPIIWEVNGETKPLSRFDWVELSADTVGFFRSCPNSRLFRVATRDCALRTPAAPAPVGLAA